MSCWTVLPSVLLPYVCRALVFWYALLLSALALPVLAQAGHVTFTTNTVITAGNRSYENFAVRVRGCTVTIEGEHTFHSLVVERFGMITHPPGVAGLHITVTNDLEVTRDGLIDLTGCGYGPGMGPGGGDVTTSNTGNGASHGGSGGRGAPGSTGVRAPYGAIV
ncbi:MAG: hypothetical protein NZ557_06940, partial [Chthonomonadaceae bacterium]|nr:hypothetical protein [Chthonomonadaceae bacterium]